LFRLEELNLRENQLERVPLEVANLQYLQHIDLTTNPKLQSPPPEIIKQGPKEIIRFLSQLLVENRTQETVKRYEAKLLLVGEGGVGKSSLLRSLRGEIFDPNLDTTHGIEVNVFLLDHPEEADTTIRLNTWDFGGQQIYHATHQFFLTKRSLYLVLWNAHKEQDKLT
jgi:internalin A